LKSNFEEVMKYARGCVDGSIIANEYRIKACQRFLDDLENENYDFRKSDPEFVINIIENTFCHQQGEMFDGTPLRGTPFILMSFHKFIIYNLLGFKIRGTNINRFHEALIFIPRKNVKTTFAAALSYGLGILYRMSGTKIYVVAAALKQTMETFGFMKYNIKNMGLGDDLRIIDNNNEHSISGEIGGGLFDFNALATNPDAQDSFNCNIAIADEIHAFKKPKQYNLFKEAMKAYTNKLMIGISTAGDDPNSFLAQRVKYCKRVLDGQVKDEQYFIFICEADMSVGMDGKKYVDYTNPKIHEMANPGYGQTIRPEEIANDAMQAQNDPQQRKDFFAKSLNVFTNQINTYFDEAMVDASDAQYSWTLDELSKLPIRWFGGADLSKMWDLTGVALYGRYKDIDIVISHAFIPVAMANLKADEDGIPVFWWEEEGWLTLCNSDVIEYEDVVDWFISMKKRGFKIQWTGYDQRYAREFTLKMKKAGFKIKNQSQRYVEKTEAFRMIESKIIMGNFYFMHNQAYRYCISNVKAIEDSDEFIRFEKVMPNQRIDLFDASVIAGKQLLIAGEKAANANTYL
jgi:phage terminase large subunit-like protein